MSIAMEVRLEVKHWELFMMVQDKSRIAEIALGVQWPVNNILGWRDLRRKLLEFIDSGRLRLGQAIVLPDGRLFATVNGATLDVAPGFID